MKIRADNGFEVDLRQGKGLGTPWVVRVTRRRFLLRRLVSSDWFLNEAQARRFAEEITRAVDSGATLDVLKTRAPGWILHRPTR